MKGFDAMKIKGIKKAVGEYNQCTATGLYCRIYLHKAEKQITCKVYADCNSWSQWDDNGNTAELWHGGGLSLTKITMQELQGLAEEAIRA